MKTVSCLLIAIILACSLPCQLDAQVSDARRQQRRDFVEDLLRTLIESQSTPRDLRHDHNNNPNINRPGQPGRPVVVKPTKEMLDARRYIGNWSEQCGHLIGDLRREENNVPRIRPLLADAVRVKASIDVLNSRCNQYAVLDPLRQDFRAIDQDWRLLNHRLQQLNGLSPECQRCINEISQYDTQLCGLFGVQPQINRRELIRVATKMDSDFQHLLQDIYYDMRNEPRMPKLLEEGKKLHARLHHSMALLQRGSYESIVEEYKVAVSEWRNFNRKICRFPSERMQRDIQNIEASGRMISELLWLPVELDREFICSVIDAMGRDSAKAFDRISLSQLMACQAPGMLLGSAREFQRQCGAFSLAVKNEQPMDELLWDFRNFEVQWADLHERMDEFVGPKVHRSIVEVDNGFVTLKQFFGDGPVINRRTLVQICSELDQFSSSLRRDIHRRIDPPRYNRSFQSEICGTADNFHRSIADLHRRVISSRKYDARPEFRGIVEQWQVLKPMLVECKTEDRMELFQLRGQIEPLMVKLQIIYAD